MEGRMLRAVRRKAGKEAEKRMRLVHVVFSLTPCGI